MGKRTRNIPECAAVYRMYDGKTCIYVGCTTNLKSRISSHKLRKRYTRLEWEQCDSDYRFALERDWIYTFRPTLNKVHNSFMPGAIKAKRHPRYIFGTKCASVVHIVRDLSCYWQRGWGPYKDEFSWTARAICGASPHFSAGSRMSNDLPPNAIVCGSCLGLGPIFKREGKFSEERKAARKALRGAA